MPFSFNRLHLCSQAVRRLALAVLFASSVSGVAWAQSKAADPLSAHPSPAPLTYKSAFEGYRSFRADEVPTWRSVNDAVRTAGGHSGSMKDAPPAQSSTGPAPMQNAPEQPAPKAMPRESVDVAPPNDHRH
jgi:hypothetical protein